MFELLQHRIKSLFLPIEKAAVMIHILLSSIDSQRWYKPVKVMINIPNIAEVIFDVVAYHHDFLRAVITNNGFLFP